MILIALFILLLLMIIAGSIIGIRFLSRDNLNKSTLQIAIKYAIICTSFSYAVIGICIIFYALIYGITFGATFLEPTLMMRPWFLKGKIALLFPFFFGFFILACTYSYLTLQQAYRSSKNPSIQHPKKGNLFISLFLLLVISVILLILNHQWSEDKFFSRNRLAYLSLSLNSANPQELRDLFEKVIASHDPDVNDPLWIIPNIAANKNSPSYLLIAIYQYALRITPDMKANIIRSLAKNPNTPQEILNIIGQVPIQQSHQEKQIITMTTSNPENNNFLSLASNANTDPDMLNKIYLQIYTQPYNENIKNIFKALAKNPHTPPDTLMRAYQKLSSSPQISYDDAIFAENPNLPLNIINSMIQKMMGRVNNISNDINSTEINEIVSIIYKITKNPAVNSDVIQEFFQFNDCTIRANLFPTVASSHLFSNVVQQLISQEQDLGNQVLFKTRMNQQVEFHDDWKEEKLTQEEMQNVNLLRQKIQMTPDSNQLENLFQSITNPKELHAVLEFFPQSCFLTPPLAEKIFQVAQGDMPLIAKENTYRALARNPVTSTQILKQIINMAVGEISRNNINWVYTLISAATNPNFPGDQIQAFMSFPSCEVRKQLILNKMVPMSAVEKMTNDSDLSVRSIAREVIKNPSKRDENTALNCNR